MKHETPGTRVRTGRQETMAVTLPKVQGTGIEIDLKKSDIDAAARHNPRSSREHAKYAVAYALKRTVPEATNLQFVGNRRTDDGRNGPAQIRLTIEAEKKRGWRHPNNKPEMETRTLQSYLSRDAVEALGAGKLKPFKSKEFFVLEPTLEQLRGREAKPSLYQSSDRIEPRYGNPEYPKRGQYAPTPAAQPPRGQKPEQAQAR